MTGVRLLNDRVQPQQKQTNHDSFHHLLPHLILLQFKHMASAGCSASAGMLGHGRVIQSPKLIHAY